MRTALVSGSPPGETAYLFAAVRADDSGDEWRPQRAPDVWVVLVNVLDHVSNDRIVSIEEQNAVVRVEFEFCVFQTCEVHL